MNKFIQKFSEAALNRASKFKANELPIQLEKLVKQYINESLNKHTNNINKLMIDNERHVMQSIDRKNTAPPPTAQSVGEDEFWKILSISLTGFGSLVGLNFIIKNEIKEELKETKNELKNDLKDLKNELKDLKNDIDKKIEKIENKLDILINMKK